MQPNSETKPISLRWRERLTLVGVGIGFGGFVFSILLGFYLFPRRPALPDPALGYTYLFKMKSHIFYGTSFESFAMSYGFLVAWCFGVVCTMAAYAQGIKLKSRTYNWHVFVTAVISMPIYAAIWWAFP